MDSDPLFTAIVSSGVLVEIGEQGVGDYPSEACGVLAGDGNRLEAVPFENIQDQLHAKDPERFPRTSRTAYSMDTLSLERARKHLDLKVIYHTHVECKAHFSGEDHRGAVSPETGEPLLPGVDYLVMSIYGHRPREANLFRYQPDTGRFIRVAGAELTG
jgi:[CysO sulfur-carrier protein]-S-L-cysteine hydrolase